MYFFISSNWLGCFNLGFYDIDIGLFLCKCITCPLGTAISQSVSS